MMQADCLAYPSPDKSVVQIYWPKLNKWEKPRKFWPGLLRACWLKLRGYNCLWVEAK